MREHLKLTLNASKPMITHARTRAARFLGYEIIVQHSDTKITNGRRAANGVIALRVPLDVIKAKRILLWVLPVTVTAPDRYGTEIPPVHARLDQVARRPA